MAKNRLHKFLSRIVEIKPGEEILAILLFSYFFLITAPYWIIKPLRDANYLHTLTYKKLPIAYLLTALFMGFVVAFHSKLQDRVKRDVLVVSSLVFFTLTCFLFWFLFFQDWSWVPLAFWVWANILIIVLGTQFWITVNDVFNPREAKRLIGFFGSGGILGGIVGGETAGLLAKSKVSNHLLLIACGMFIACIFIVHYVFVIHRKGGFIAPEAEKKDIEREKGMRKVGLRDCFDTVRKNFYLKLLAGVVTVTLVVSTLIDFQFKGVVDTNVSGKNNLTAFFGHFYAGLLIFSFFLQLLMASKIIKRYGIRITLLLFPLVLLLCSLGIAILPILFFAVVIKGSDKSLSYSINQSVRELLYIPVSPEFKYKAKIFIDMFLNRFAKGLGAVIILILLSFKLGVSSVRLVSFVSFFFIMGWIVLNLKVSKEYVSTVKQKLELKWDRADRILAEKVDMDYTKLVFDILESKNRSSVLYAMHLFDLIKRDKLTPEVKKLISYKSDEIRASSLKTLLDVEETTWIPDTEDYISDVDLEKEIKEIMSLDVYQEVMKNYVGEVVTDESQEAEIAKMEIAKAIGMMKKDSPLAQELDGLLLDKSPEVSRYAVESAAELRRRDLVPDIIEKLKNPVTREDATAALEKYGSRITGTLADYLADSKEDIELRKATASVLGRISTQDAADLLSWELSADREDVEDEIIDALDRISSEKPEVQFSREVIESKIIEKIKKYYQVLIEDYDSKQKGKKVGVSKDPPKTLSASLMNIFKLLELIYPREDITRAYQNVRAGTKDSMAYAVELLDNILKKELKDIILPLVENLSPEERVRRCRSLLRTFPKARKPYGQKTSV